MCKLQNISYRTAESMQRYAYMCIILYLINATVTLCLLCRGQVSVQQFRGGVVLRMCRGLTITLFVRFFDKYTYYVATIPKSRIEILS